MKRIKKLASLMLAMIMVLAMGITAFAEGEEIPPASAPTPTVTVTLPTKEDSEGTGIEKHQFFAYAIFTGTQGDDNVLGDVEWGNGIDHDEFVKELSTTEEFDGSNPFASLKDKTGVTALEVAAIMDTSKGFTIVQAEVVARIAYEHINDTEETRTKLDPGTNTLPSGYYLIVDKGTDGTGTLGQGEVLNAALLQATTNVTVGVKTTIPTASKKVEENNAGNLVNAGKDAASTALGGDNSKYNDVADYNIGDDVPFGFYSKVPDMSYYTTYKYVFHDKMSAGLSFNNDVEVTIGGKELTEGTDYTVVQGSSDGCSFEVQIDDLKSIQGIKTGDDIIVKFTAELTAAAAIGGSGNTNEMHLEFSNNPNDSNSTTTTKKDTVVVFTYELDTTKIDGAETDKKLPDAEFKLYRTVGEEGSEENEYVTVDAEGKVSGWTKDKDAASTLKSGQDGLFKVIGLDEGVYYLEETKAPAGYNLLTAPIEVTIEATTENTQNLTSVSAALTSLTVTTKIVGSTDKPENGTGSPDSGVVGISVVNNQGSLLPSTGGIGTTIFYVVGGILVVGAGILLVAKKRMGAHK